MNKLDSDYQNLLKDILENGIEKTDRTGTGTISVFGRQIRHKMSDGFPLLTTKKMAWKTMVTELLWFLRGDTNIKYLVDNGCHIWDGDAYKAYQRRFKEKHYLKPTSTKEEFIERIKTDDEFAKKWGELGPIYGKQWRSWTKKKMWLSTDGSHENIYDEADQTVIDQISILINDLKTNPDSRRLMVNAWNVGELDQMVLPPCHYGFQVYTRELSLDERINIYNSGVVPMNQSSDYFHWHMDDYGVPRRAISLMWNQRSVDTFLGLPFNIASYGLLLEIIAKEVNMVPDELIGNLGDVHLYSNHIEQAKEQIGRVMTTDERMDWWLKNIQPNRDACEGIYELHDHDKHVYFNAVKVPTRTREPYPLPKLNINTEFWQTESGDCGVGQLNTNLTGFEISDFQIQNYKCHPPIKAPLSN